eukprot:CAMPEP_0178904604 /NCGR_PEP_ID=MMETSP0786-20121207/5793_1 /TAXON_ID=186022 /ORGANISM="Thalassionema frauenfeldii, Strain CCMP 1798" /LENGTH=310 /DNA_ID=CAMNT_0020576081 /DNA_START=69 /DNA_END=1002 /DNA_ORIENTATION=-
MSEDDPFGCFGSDDDEEEDACQIVVKEKSNPGKKFATITRDEESSGVLAFHANTERSLLMHVKNSDADDDVSLPNKIDWFCSSRHWMMHVGPEKGTILQQCLQDAIQNVSKLEKKTFVAVELGTYCGYASILLSSILKTHPETFQDGMDFKFFTVEINPDFSAIAREMIQLSKLDETITVLDNDLLMDGSTSDAAALVKRAIVEKIGPSDSPIGIDFLLIDHDKDSYLTDLVRFERSGLIRRGTVIAADNVIFAGITDYINYMQKLAKEGFVTTCTKESNVEYSPANENIKDGIEMTEYLRDPSNIDKSI